jgi:hypothetical protein
MIRGRRRKTTISNLNEDCLFSIFCHLDNITDIIRVSHVCRQWRHTVNNDNVTRKLYPIVPSQVQEGLIILCKGRGYNHDIVVFYSYTEQDINAAMVWRQYFPNYPKLSGTLFENVRVIDDFVYPQIFQRAALQTTIDNPMPVYKHPRPDLIQHCVESKIVAEEILTNNILNDDDYVDMMWSYLGMFRNTPRKARFIPLLLNQLIGSDTFIKYDKSTITDEVLYPSYNDPYYDKDVLRFFSEFPNMVNWKDSDHDDPCGTTNPYRYMDEKFIMSHKNLWHLWDWKKIFDCVSINVWTKKQIQKELKF